MTSQPLITTITLATSHGTLCVQKKQIKIPNFQQSMIYISLIDLQLNSQRFLSLDIFLTCNHSLKLINNKLNPIIPAQNVTKIRNLSLSWGKINENK